MLHKREEASLQHPDFRAIYDIAIAQDYTGLYRLREKLGSIDFYIGPFSPTMLLALHGQTQAVDFLLQEFNLPVASALKGYACAGNHQTVEKILNAGASVRDAIIGYAMGGLIEQADALVNDESLEIFKSIGLAYAGSIAELPAGKDNKNMIATALAQAGHTDLLHKFFEEKMDAYLPAILQGYATSGAVEKVDQYATGEHDEDYFSQLMRAIMKGYALGGHVIRANEIALAYVSYGNYHEIEVNQKKFLQPIIEIYLAGAQFHAAASLVTNDTLRYLPKNLKYFHTVNQVNDFLMNIDNHETRLHLATEMADLFKTRAATQISNKYDFQGMVKEAETIATMQPQDYAATKKAKVLSKTTSLSKDDAQQYLKAGSDLGLLTFMLRADKHVPGQILPPEMQLLILQQVTGVGDAKKLSAVARQRVEKSQSLFSEQPKPSSTTEATKPKLKK